MILYPSFVLKLYRKLRQPPVPGEAIESRGEPIAAISSASITSNCILTVYPYTTDKCGSHPLAKKLLFAGDRDRYRKPQAADRGVTSSTRFLCSTAPVPMAHRTPQKRGQRTGTSSVRQCLLEMTGKLRP